MPYGSYGSKGEGKGVIRVSGVESTQKRLAAIRSDIARNLATATVTGSMLINNRSKEICPVLTGNLERSIHPLLTEVTTTKVEVQVGTDVEYAPYVELGTAKKGPRSFLRRAFDEKYEATASEIQRVWQALIAAHMLRPF